MWVRPAARRRPPQGPLELLEPIRQLGRTAWRRAARWALPWALLCFALVWVLAVWRDVPRGLAQKTVIVLILGWMICVLRALAGRVR